MFHHEHAVYSKCNKCIHTNRAFLYICIDILYIVTAWLSELHFSPLALKCKLNAHLLSSPPSPLLQQRKKKKDPVCDPCLCVLQVWSRIEDRNNNKSKDRLRNGAERGASADCTGGWLVSHRSWAGPGKDATLPCLYLLLGYRKPGLL